MKKWITVCCALWCYTQAALAIDLELTQGINSALPIGIESFGASTEASTLTNVIQNDLRLTGQFKWIEASPYAKRTPLEWQHLGADSIVTGSVTPAGGGRYAIHLSLLDAAANGRVLLAKDYQVSSGELRRLAHHLSDEIYQKLTGVRGIFSTRIAYVLVQREGMRARYSLEIADVDGSNPHSLLVSPAPIMSPSWSPDARQIAYVSFEKKRAQIFTVSVETGQRRLVTDFPGINGAPAWSPDGRQMAVVLSKGGTPKIYMVSLSTGEMKQVTFGEAIDTEPKFSPDGASLLFTSGRGGSPQVYSLNLASGGISRMTYAGNYNAKASYTPNQQHIVMLHRADKGFNIGVMKVGKSDVTPVTDSPADESPSVAPNGHFILYATRVHDKGVLAMVALDGHTSTSLPARDGDIQEPAWSPYLG